MTVLLFMKMLIVVLTVHLWTNDMFDDIKSMIPILNIIEHHLLYSGFEEVPGVRNQVVMGTFRLVSHRLASLSYNHSGYCDY